MLIVFHLLSFSYESEILKDGIRYTTSIAPNILIVGTNKQVSGNAYIDTNIVDVVLPKFVDNYIVKIIGTYAFRNVSPIKSIFIPNTIQEIKYDGISHNENLKQVKFETDSSLTIIGRGFLYNTQVTDIELPPSVTYVYLYSFGVTEMKSIVYCGHHLFSESTIFVNSETNQYNPPEHIYVSKRYKFTSFGKANNLETTSFCEKYFHSNPACSYSLQIRLVRLFTFLIIG